MVLNPAGCILELPVANARIYVYVRSESFFLFLEIDHASA